jgi:hypothetical protein
MKTKIVTFIGFLFYLTVICNLEAASANHTPGYSFSKILENAYIKSPGQEKLQERVEMLVMAGVLTKNKRGYQFFTRYPLNPVEASVGEGFGESITREVSMDYHDNGDSWPLERLHHFFVEGFVRSILYQYDHVRNAISRFPFIISEVFKTNSEAMITSPPGSPFLIDTPELWWKNFYLKALGTERGGWGFDDLLNFGDFDPPEGRRPAWSSMVLNDLKAEIESDHHFCQFGASYLKSKVLEEKLNQRESFSDMALKAAFMKQITIVMNSLNSCINNFVKFAIYHRFLNLSMDHVIKDSFIGTDRRSSLERDVLSLEELHRQVIARLDQR